jgi:hypothetical protein
MIEFRVREPGSGERRTTSDLNVRVSVLRFAAAPVASVPRPFVHPNLAAAPDGSHEH